MFLIILNISVDDGTGRMQVLFEWDKLNKLKEERKKIDLKFQRLSKIAEIKNSGAEEIQVSNFLNYNFIFNVLFVQNNYNLHNFRI